MTKLWLTILLVPCGCLTAYADTRTIEGVESNPPSIAEVRKTGLLVDNSARQISVCLSGEPCLTRQSDLTVSYVVTQMPPSTDVSAYQELYLTMHNSVEETAVAYSMHLIADIEKLKSARRVNAGIYQFNVIRINEKPTTDCWHVNQQITVDARALSTKVRKAKRIDNFEDANYRDPIFAAFKTLKCVRRANR